MNPTSWIVAPAQSSPHAENATLYFRGNWNETGSSSSRSVTATEYGATSKTSSGQMPDSKQDVIFRTVLPPPPLHESPAAASERKAGRIASIDTRWI